MDATSGVGAGDEINTEDVMKRMNMMNLKLKAAMMVVTAGIAVAGMSAKEKEKTVKDALTGRQSHLVAIAALEAKADIAGLRCELDAALDDGVTVSEAKEALSQLYAYTGFPRSLNGLSALQTVLEERKAAGKKTAEGKEAKAYPKTFDALKEGAKVQTQLRGGEPLNYSFAPATDYYLKAHLFGDIFARDNLTFADRELVTIGALSALEGVESQRKSHVAGSLNMGVTRDELRAIPAALRSKGLEAEAARAQETIAEVLADKLPAGFTSYVHGGDFGMGPTNDAYARYFVGQSYLKRLTGEGDPIGISNVTFEPGCRNNWHIHHAETGGGQVLICVEGEGWVQEWGKPAVRLKAGDVYEIPAGVKHWHGAAADSWFSHLAFDIPGTGASNEWLEPVSDAEYAKLK